MMSFISIIIIIIIIIVTSAGQRIQFESNRVNTRRDEMIWPNWPTPGLARAI